MSVVRARVKATPQKKITITFAEWTEQQQPHVPGPAGGRLPHGRLSSVSCTEPPSSRALVAPLEVLTLGDLARRLSDPSVEPHNQKIPRSRLLERKEADQRRRAARKEVEVRGGGGDAQQPQRWRSMDQRRPSSVDTHKGADVGAGLEAARTLGTSESDTPGSLTPDSGSQLLPLASSFSSWARRNAPDSGRATPSPTNSGPILGDDGDIQIRVTPGGREPPAVASTGSPEGVVTGHSPGSVSRGGSLSGRRVGARRGKFEIDDDMFSDAYGANAGLGGEKVAGDDGCGGGDSALRDSALPPPLKPSPRPAGPSSVARLDRTDRTVPGSTAMMMAMPNPTALATDVAAGVAKALEGTPPFAIQARFTPSPPPDRLGGWLDT